MKLAAIVLHGLAGLDSSSDEPLADRQARPDRQHRQLDAVRRQVLAGRTRLDPVAVGLDAPDRLEGEEADRPVRPAVHGVVVVGVAVEAHRPDPRLGHRAASGRRRARC